ncbi:hypothetical protein GCM10010515_25770 [Streptomyces fructofermentans]|uniref:Uncharacterized protein n=1 Tax=Streptomyces fructofermentans TaxID=152141 RepID=A0A918NC59_9ACTN|nr:hypothetical protein GCM10010515_25770 [Streptomyces fructofermentans]
MGSALSIGSIGSSLSIGSIGSGMSLLSAGSIQSIGSVFSAQGRWSLMTAGPYRLLGSPGALTALSVGGLALVGALALRTRGARR